MTRFDRLLTRWMGRETTETVTPPPALAFVDARIAELDTVRRDLTECRATLARAEARWAVLKTQADDPESQAQRLAVGPRVLDLRQQMRRLTTEEARLEVTIAQTAAQVEAYAQMLASAEAWLLPLLAALPSADLLTRAYRLSRDLDRHAADLLARTGDRQFRRAVVDPYRALHDALTEAVKLLDRQRLAVRAGGASETKSA